MDDVVIRYKKYRSRSQWFMIGLVILLMMVGLGSLLIGSQRFGLDTLINLCWGDEEVLNQRILLYIRLPRILGAILTGMLLALSGVVMQTLLRNPLASPYTLGISNASAFGASFGIVFLSASGQSLPYLISLSALGGGVLGLGGVLLLANTRQASVETIVLAGVIINSLFGAGITVLQYLADHVQLASIVFWNFGDLGQSDWQKLCLLGVIFLVCWIYFYRKRWDYKVLSAGEDYARSMGVNPRKHRLMGLFITSLCTAVAVSFFGVIAFVGLVVPHMVRMCIGENEEFLLPASALFGGVFLLACDTLARTILNPIVLPVGILTSSLGVPLFLFLLVRKKKDNRL